MSLKPAPTILFFLWVLYIQPAQAQNVNLEKYSGQVQTITRSRIASTSVLSEKWDKQANWERIEEMARKAAVQGGALAVVTPEGALEGYVINEVNSEKDQERKALLVRNFFDLGEPIHGPYIKNTSKTAGSEKKMTLKMFCAGGKVEYFSSLRLG